MKPRGERIGKQPDQTAKSERAKESEIDVARETEGMLSRFT